MSRAGLLAGRFLPWPGRRPAARATGRRVTADGVPPRAQRAVPLADDKLADPSSVLLQRLCRGEPLVEALVAQTSALLAAGDVDTALSLAGSLDRRSETQALGALVGSIVAHRRGHLDLAWSLSRQVPDELRWRYGARAHVQSGIAIDRDAVLDELRDLARTAPATVPPETWLELVGAALGAGEEHLAREAFAALDRAVDGEEPVSPDLVVSRDWLRPWVAASASSPSAPAPAPGHIPFAVMNYGHPGRSRASANLGDHVQTIASLGHLVRHRGVRFHGDDDVVGVVAELQERVHPRRRLPGHVADVDLVLVDRDASAYAPVPPDTWFLAFGWYMHAIFEQRYGFPFHRNLLPIFVSFHCNKRDLLTAQALDYLREHGPVGCRDWTTVDILLSLDVPAFFSGCLTTTVDTVFPALDHGPAPGAPTAYVDMPPESLPRDAVAYAHSNDAVRFRGFGTNVRDALGLLETYRRNHPAVVTSRLHCWLPLRSLGVPVDFRPANRADIRFAGLIDTSPEEFDRIRQGINTKLEGVFTRILTGASPAEVYRTWRELTAADVEVARERRARPPRPGGTGTDVEPEVARAVAATVSRAATKPPPRGGDGPRLHLVVHVPAGRQQALTVMLESLVRHSSQPLDVRLVTRKPAAVDLDDLADLFPEVSLSLVPTPKLGAAVRRGDGRPTAARDVDLMALAGLLPDVDRAVVLPSAALVLGDVAELHGLALGGHLLAAPDLEGRAGASGFGVVHTACLRLGSDTAAATELRRQAYARHRFDFDAFSTNVLVLDLARFRTELPVSAQVRWVEEFGLTFRELLHVVVGPDRAVVPPSWNWVPTRAVVEHPSLAHWADRVKPWEAGFVRGQDRWLAVDAELRQRRVRS